MGLCEITPSVTSPRQTIAYPGIKIGSIHFVNISTVIGMGNLDNNTLGKIDAHEEEISCLAINVHGTLIASSSSKGTSIRIWNIVFKIMVCELRFGPNIATLYCINFSPTSTFLCCSDFNGKIQIFKVIESEMALASFTVLSEKGCICTFLTPKTVVAIYFSGIYRLFKFSEDGTNVTVERQLFLQ